MERFSRDESPLGHPRVMKTALGHETPRESVSRQGLKQDWDPDLWRRQMEEAGFVGSSGHVLSRRNLLIGGATLAAGLAIDNIGKFSPLAKWLDDKIAGQFDYDEVVKEAKSFMKERYHIDLVIGVKEGQNDILGDAVTLEKYRTILRVIMQEMSKYPSEMIQKIGEGPGFELRIIDNLYTKGPLSGFSSNFSNIGQRVGGIAPFRTEDKPAQLILDSNQMEYIQRQTLHHELNHLSANKWENRQERDQRWMGFHKKISKDPYHRVSSDTKAEDPPKEPYFLTNYASSAPVEDQAVCAEWMMTPLLHAEFVKRWQDERDPSVREVLSLKYVETVREYNEWSGGKIDDAFWDTIWKQGLREKQNPQRNG